MKSAPLPPGKTLTLQESIAILKDWNKHAQRSYLTIVLDELERLQKLTSKPEVKLPEELKLSIERAAIKLNQAKQSNLKTLTLTWQQTEHLIYAAKQSAELQEQFDCLDNEIGEFQNQVRDLIMKLEPSCNPDGGGCESGDWRDFTLSEIGQGMVHVIDQRDEVRKQSLAKDQLIEKLVKVLTDFAFIVSTEEHCQFMREVLAQERERGFGK